MFTYLDTTGSVKTLQQLLEVVQVQPGVKGLLVLVADANDLSPERLNPLLQNVQLPVFGGVFPAVIYQGHHYTRGSVVVGLPVAPRLTTIRGLSCATPATLEAAMAVLEDVNDAPGTAFCWADGFSQQLTPLLQAFHSQVGLKYKVIGGGAGSLDLHPKPCIITNAGLLEDAAVLAIVDLPSGVAARHGWVKLSGPYHVTESAGNVIYTLNWRPALQVYKAAVSSVYTKEWDEERFYEVAQNFPFGIQRYGVERVVRDPVRAEGESLVCIGDVPQGALVDILSATQTSLLVAADEALLEAESQLRRYGRAHTVFIVDCVSRMIFLQDRFQRELINLYLPGTATVGVLSLGEFACNGRDYPSFLNKTTVVGMFSI